MTTTKKGWQEFLPDFPTDRRVTLAGYRLAKLDFTVASFHNGAFRKTTNPFFKTQH
jgi:hypothetical protein